eukprot:CAMPEP_0206401262 /NCGR_PEP_ID=MMETSP0294-20121207/26150_1 /ASSEMBLY_ACC=CAM_ASM_000327 /TAXON_ID=39354 /ORGANISM="Heterosigma akashiwo, Strain CCMP2393" /LENGTH=101 /DNA_ID=CAMNT_0053857899 /DNA_START=99 /DNA_END=402 /DNA_ORIENTATION=+
MKFPLDLQRGGPEGEAPVFQRQAVLGPVGVQAGLLAQQRRLAQKIALGSLVVVPNREEDLGGAQLQHLIEHLQVEARVPLRAQCVLDHPALAHVDAVPVDA